MNQKELEKLEKNSLYTMKVSPDIKEQVVSGHLNELCRVVKREIRKSEVIVTVIKIT
jgi:hypothetical protein